MARGGFPGIPGGNMQQLMRQAQKMQQQMMKAQEDLDAREYEGTAGGGAVSCKVSGKRQLLSLTIDKDAGPCTPLSGAGQRLPEFGGGGGALCGGAAVGYCHRSGDWNGGQYADLPL